MQKKVMALCLRVQFFLANPVDLEVFDIHSFFNFLDYCMFTLRLIALSSFIRNMFNTCTLHFAGR